MKALAVKKDFNMTEGAIWKKLLWFAIPLLIGNAFQQLYNTVDSIVVGNFVGKEALAAVGCTDSVISTVIGFFVGLSSGAGVVISQYFGAKDYEKLQKAVHTTIVMTFFMSIIVTILGIVMVPSLLKVLGTPEDVMPEAITYLRIYFYGITGVMFYNMGAGILRAVGDSKRPLYFLIFSAIVNIVLDLVFVIYFHWGVAGVAYATTISQILSSILILITLTKEKGPYRIIWRKLGISTKMLGTIIKIGLPSAIQMAITAFSNVFVKSYIFAFGSDCMAGWSAYAIIEKFCMLPIQSIALAITTFVGQNIGARQVERAKKGIWVAVCMSLITTVVIMTPLIIFAPTLVSMINQESEVIRFGALFLRLMLPFYVLCCGCDTFAGAMRGAGATRATMIILMGSFVVFRQIYMFVISRVTDTVIWVSLGYPAGWLICIIAFLLYYRFSHWEKHSIVET